MGVAQSNGRRTPKVHSDTDEGLEGPEAQTSNDVSHVAKDRSVAPRRREGRGLSGGGKVGQALAEPIRETAQTTLARRKK